MKKENLIKFSKNTLIDMVIEAYDLFSGLECNNAKLKMRAEAVIMLKLKQQTKSWLIEKMETVVEINTQRDDIIAQFRKDGIGNKNLDDDEMVLL